MPIVQSFTNPPPSPHHQGASVGLSISGNISIKSQSPNGATFRLRIGGSIDMRGKFVFSIPPPILNEIDENAFPAHQVYSARITDDLGNVIDITDAVKSQSKGEIGERYSVTVAKKDILLISPDGLYTFEIYAGSWETVCQDARLESRAFSDAQRGRLPDAGLSFEISEASGEQLKRYPSKNYILYDSLQIKVETGDIERVYCSDGEYIRTTSSAFPNLTFYKLLTFICQRLDLTTFETNVPNFPVVRADFPFNRTYGQSLAGIAGMYEPIYSVNNNVLTVQTKYAELPDDFEPRELTIDHYSNIRLQIPQNTHVDGVIIGYVDSNALADFYEDRLVQTREETGTFGNSDYTRTDINRTYREWFENENPNVPLRTELITEVHATYNNTLDLIGRETNNHAYDAQGKRTNSARAVESLVPDLDNAGTPALLTVREENQSVFYTADVQNPKRQLQSKTITQMSGLTAIDAENQYFDEDFKQDFLEAHKAGNLTAGMTSQFGLLKTVTETLTPLGNNQFEVRTSTVDHLRGSTTNSVSEAKTGDASLNGVGGKTRRFILWADGVTSTSRTGGEIVDLVVGELPLEFAKVFGGIVLSRRISALQDGQAVIAGYDKSLKAGVFVRIFDRENNSYGRFIVESVETVFNNLGMRGKQIVTTSIQISET